MFSRSISTGKSSSGEKIGSLAVGRLEPFQQTERDVQGWDTLLGHRSLGVESEPTEPRLELLVGEVRQDVSVTEVGRFEEHFEIESSLLEPWSRLPGRTGRDTNLGPRCPDLQAAHSGVTFERERHGFRVGDQAGPETFRSRMDQLHRAPNDPIQADEPVPFDVSRNRFAHSSMRAESDVAIEVSAMPFHQRIGWHPRSNRRIAGLKANDHPYCQFRGGATGTKAVTRAGGVDSMRRLNPTTGFWEVSVRS